MRGEETQLVGAAPKGHHICILPGTHSKWAEMEQGRILRFATFLSGDLYHAITRQTILQTMPPGEWSDEAFLFGVTTGFHRTQEGRTLLSGLFQLRVRSILDLPPDMDGRSVLSGILIGCEVAEGSKEFVLQQQHTPVLVIGSQELTRLYLLALEACGMQGTTGPKHAVARGLYQIARIKKIL
jgi:2-dehydro-3-deoxygalactonokinase